MLRVGRIDYANTLPMYFCLDARALAGVAEFVSTYPAELNRKMAAGEVDMGPISSFAYGQHFREYLLLPHLSVSARGKVRSILLFLRRPLPEIRRQGFVRLALTNRSATSAHLVQILFRGFYGLEVESRSHEPELQAMLAEHDGALLIGDEAIREAFRARGLFVYDVGELWFAETGLPMTYAVFAVREDTWKSRTASVEVVYRELLKSRRLSERDFLPLVEAVQGEVGGDAEFWHSYFSDLSFDLGPEEEAGLALYFSWARRLGFLQEDVRLRYASLASV